MLFLLATPEYNNIQSNTTKVKVHLRNGVAEILEQHQDLMGKVENNLLEIEMQVELLCHGEVKDRGQGAIVLDGPLSALQAMVEAMAATTPHWSIAAGDVVTTGTITDAWPLVAGQRWETRLSDPRLSALALETTA